MTFPEEMLPYMKKIKYLVVLLGKERKERLTSGDKWCGILFVVVKTKLSRKATLSIYWSFFDSTLTHGPELWVGDQKSKIVGTCSKNEFLS